MSESISPHHTTPLKTIPLHNIPPTIIFCLFSIDNCIDIEVEHIVLLLFLCVLHSFIHLEKMVFAVCTIYVRTQQLQAVLLLLQYERRAAKWTQLLWKHYAIKYVCMQVIT